MGMIMNRFNMLSEMRDSMRSNKPEADRYRQFVLTGVVVHDPNDHKLRQLMQEKFFDWSRTTGPQFLFITFIPLPPLMRVPCDYKFNRESLISEPSMTCEDEPQISSLLRRFFGLPASGSYLMLTENISSSSFSRIPIYAETIQQQFKTITAYCETSDSKSPASYQALLQQLEGLGGTLEKSFIDALINVTALSSSVTSHFCGLKQKKHIDAWFEFEMQKIRHALEDLLIKEKYADQLFVENDIEQISEKEGQNEKMFQLFQDLAMGLKKINYRPFHRLSHNLFPQSSRNDIDIDNGADFDCNASLLSEYSKDLYQSYLLLRGYVRDRCSTRFEYSGLTTYFGKILENELHLSVCQMLRQVHGIPMPKYFNIHCDEHEPVDINVGHGHFAHLNYYDPSQACESINRRQMSVPVGLLLNAYKRVRQRVNNGDEGVIRVFFREVSEDLVDFCMRFNNNYRNPTSHIDYNSRRTYKEARCEFSIFLSNYLPELARMRRQLEPEHITVYRHDQEDR